MVSAPLMTQGVEVDLPRPGPCASSRRTRTPRPVGEEGRHALPRRYKVELDQLEGHLKTLVANQKRACSLIADKEVPYGTVVTVMGEIKAAGIDKLGVVAEDKREPAKK